MNYLRQLQAERPVLFWMLVMVGVYLAFQILILVASLLLSGFSVPSWAPLVLVLGVLIVIARKQQR